MENDFQKITPPCLLCGVSAQLFGSKWGYHLYRCPSCRFLFVFPVPVDVSSVYDEGYFTGGDAGVGYADYDRDKAPMSKSFTQYCALIERLYPQKGTLFDVGAATGFFLGVARARGWHVSGVEVSPYAARIAQQKGFDVRIADFSSLALVPNSFDVITMFDVLEHFSRPLQELQTAFRVLKPGGLLVINTPDASSFFAILFGIRWHLIVPPEHLYYFNSTNCARLLRSLGFRVRYSGKIWKSFTFYYIFHTLYRSQGFVLWRMFAALFRGRFLRKLAIPVPPLDSFFLIAEKL